jgi:putative ABC transport system permease protein
MRGRGVFREWVARFWGTLHPHRGDGDLEQELRIHQELAEEHARRHDQGLDDSARLARITAGGVSQAMEALRDQRSLPWLDGVLYDLRFALRGLRRERAFTLTAVTTLALAIGLNVTVFAVMNTMLFRGFPLVKRNERLVYLQERYPAGLCCGTVSYPDFEDWRAHAQSFEGMAFIGAKRITFADSGSEQLIDSLTFTISANTFSLLGVSPLLGRDFVKADEASDALPVAILSHRFWKRRFDQRLDIVGHIVRIDNAPATVIGVMPEGFDFPSERDLWMPLAHTGELHKRGPMQYMAVGRLADSATVAGARVELETINRRLGTSYPATNRDVMPRVYTYSQMFVGPNAPVVYGSLWAAAWFVLLIACANLANLTLARTLGRSREFSTRIALGAGRWRMVRQILTESLLLAGASGVLAWRIAAWSVRTWAVATASTHQVLDYAVDAGTLVYLIAISIAAALLCGLVPIVRVLQLDVNGTLKGEARGTTQGLRGKYLSASLVAGQMALAIVLLSGAGVLARSLFNIVGAKTGVRDPGHVLVGSLRLLADKYPSPATRLAYFDRLAAQLRGIPGIDNASVASAIPVDGGRAQAFEIEGTSSALGAGESGQFLNTGSDYFRVLGDSPISGRDFNDDDRMTGAPVAIVNQAFAATFFPDGQVLGKRLRSLDRDKKPSEWRTIVGVVPNVMQGDVTRQRFKPLIYVPLRQEPPARAFFLVRTTVAADGVAQAVRAEVQKLDPGVVLENFTTLKASFAFDRDQMDREHQELGKYAAVAPIFALMAFVLAALGLYAAIAHSVSQRTPEIGVRIALGAAPPHIRGLIFREGMRPVVFGLFIGLILSLVVNRILQSQLVGVSPYDPVTLTAAPAMLTLVALLACQLPSRRALRIDPMVALRHD